MSKSVLGFVCGAAVVVIGGYHIGRAIGIVNREELRVKDSLRKVRDTAALLNEAIAAMDDDIEFPIAWAKEAYVVRHNLKVARISGNIKEMVRCGGIAEEFLQRLHESGVLSD